MSKEIDPKSSQDKPKQKPSRLPSLPKVPKSLKLPSIKDIPGIKGTKGINPKNIIERIITVIQISKSGGGGGLIDMSDSGKAGGLTRPMKYPYTLGAKIGQFPYKFMMNTVWPFKYYLIAVVVTLPVFYKLGKLSHHPNNVRTWQQIRKELFTPGHH